MNQLIKKLAENSGFYFYDLHDIDGQDLGETIESDDWESMDRFAKLIIQECVDVHHEHYQLDIISDVINKHFGFE